MVDDLPSACALAEKLLGVAAERTVDIPGRLQSAFYRVAGVALELIEISEPNERARRLGGAAARIEHVALEVDDLDVAASELKAIGVAFTSANPSVLGPTRSLLTAPDSTDGIPYQVFDRRIGD